MNRGRTYVLPLFMLWTQLDHGWLVAANPRCIWGCLAREDDDIAAAQNRNADDIIAGAAVEKGVLSRRENTDVLNGDVDIVIVQDVVECTEIVE